MSASSDGPSSKGPSSDDPRDSGAFWRTIPGILTGVAALITAVTGLIIGLGAMDSSSGDGPLAPAVQRTTSGSSTPDARPMNADEIAGTWSGTARRKGGRFEVDLSVSQRCTLTEMCGSIHISPKPTCFGDLSLKAISGHRYEFSVNGFSASSSKVCSPGAGEYLTPRGDDSLLYTTGYDRSVRGILRPPR